jgi:pyrroline-5-carboxylate reductase
MNPDGTPAKLRLALIGAGNMAEALVRGALAAGIVEPDQVIASDPAPPRRELFASLGIVLADDNLEAAGAVGTIVLAVKPQVLESVLEELAGRVDGKLVVSIVAGATSARISRALGPDARIVRTMPNTPLLVDMGATAIAPGPGATSRDMTLVRALFGAGGQVFEMTEEHMDAVTAVSGTGPAYLFYLAEAMMEASEAEGFSATEAKRLVGATLKGAGELLYRSEHSARDLRRRVTTPGGTTAAAVEVLDGAGVHDKLVAAVRRAAERSRELGRG